MASTETSTISLPANTALHDKWFPVEPVHMILLPAKTAGLDEWLPAESRDSVSCRNSHQEAESHGQTWQEAIFHRQ